VKATKFSVKQSVRDPRAVSPEREILDSLSDKAVCCPNYGQRRKDNPEKKCAFVDPPHPETSEKRLKKCRSHYRSQCSELAQINTDKKKVGFARSHLNFCEFSLTSTSLGHTVFLHDGVIVKEKKKAKAEQAKAAEAAEAADVAPANGRKRRRRSNTSTQSQVGPGARLLQHSVCHVTCVCLSSV
jgi:hypothetical protein